MQPSLIKSQVTEAQEDSHTDKAYAKAMDFSLEEVTYLG